MIISQKLPSRLEEIRLFLDSAVDKIRPLLTEEEVFQVKLSIEEALVNAIKHGNKLNPRLYAEVTIEAKDNLLTITVVGQGKGFNFDKVADPTHPDNIHKPSGRGIFLIKKFMDRVEFIDRGRAIKMSKLLKPKEGK